MTINETETDAMNTTEKLQYNLQKALYDHISDYVQSTENISLLDVASQIGIAVTCNLFNALSYSELSEEDNRVLFGECIKCIDAVAPEIYNQLVIKKSNKEEEE